ncbi:MAG: hypothetical protein ACOX6O_08475 [Christensenellales bacterium]|jgi:ppGpp synthetase/RelA/SpoT-type nucleotidyltranferase
MNIKDQLLEVFSDEDFQKRIFLKRIQIEGILKDFIYGKEILSLKISKNISSRIKSEDSFKEKINRKNYINIWGIKSTDNSEEIERIICEKLSDLIGFRINCYFKADEDFIYSRLLDYLKEQENIIVEETPNTRQQNGREIFKVSCQYKEESSVFSFEVQVKSYLNDVWGEVEHSIIYKEKPYDSRRELKVEIVDGIYDILNGAERQLKNLYSLDITNKEIERELFYRYSKEKLKDKQNTNILGKHYRIFFELIKWVDHDSDNSIRKYLGKNLLGQNYEKTQIHEVEVSDEDLNKYEEVLDIYKWNIFTDIVGIIYDYKTKKSLLMHMITRIKKEIISNDELNNHDMFNDEEDDFSIQEETGENETDEVYNLVIKILDCIVDGNKMLEGEDYVNHH